MEGSVCWSPAALDRCWNWEVAPVAPVFDELEGGIAGLGGGGWTVDGASGMSWDCALAGCPLAHLPREPPEPERRPRLLARRTGIQAFLTFDWWPHGSLAPEKKYLGILGMPIHPNLVHLNLQD